MNAATDRHLAFDLLRLGRGDVLVVREGVRVVRTTRYHLSEVPAPLGRVFAVVKFLSDGGDGETYTVRLGEQDTCTCRGRRGACRHRLGVRDLVSRGKL